MCDFAIKMLDHLALCPRKKKKNSSALRRNQERYKSKKNQD